MFLAIDARILFAQLLVHAGQFRRKIQAALIALRGILLQCHRHDILEILGNIGAQGVNRGAVA